MTATAAPVYRHHVFLCSNLRAEDHPRGSCGRKGAAASRDFMAGRIKELRLPQVRVSTAGCLGRCRTGPVLVIYPDGVWYGYRSEADIDEIIETHLVQGGIVTRLLLNPATPQDVGAQCPPADA
jgi:(2Fe-2S) ferredoxin